MKKYVAVAAAVIMQVCLGGIYAWSAFVPALRGQFGYSSAQTQVVFGSTIGLIATAMLFTGRLQDRIGPRPMGLLAGILTFAQYVCAGSFGDHFYPLWASISGLGGLAVGCGYVSALATGVKWFPHRKGLISGLTVAGYGGGAILLQAIAHGLLARGWTPLEIFKVVGCTYGPVAAVMGLLLFTPALKKDDIRQSYPVKFLLRDRRFWALAIGMFCGTFPGLALIGNLEPIGLAAGVPVAMAAGAIGILGAGNASGRIGWGALQDRFGFRVTTLTCLSLAALASGLFLLVRDNGWVFVAISGFLGFCFGGSLSLYAAQSAQHFGILRFGSTYPVVMLAHGAAALTGPTIMGWTNDLTGSFSTGILIAFAVGIAGVVGYAWFTRPRPTEAVLP